MYKKIIERAMSMKAPAPAKATTKAKKAKQATTKKASKAATPKARKAKARKNSS